MRSGHTCATPPPREAFCSPRIPAGCIPPGATVTGPPPTRPAAPACHGLTRRARPPGTPPESPRRGSMCLCARSLSPAWKASFVCLPVCLDLPFSPQRPPQAPPLCPPTAPPGSALSSRLLPQHVLQVTEHISSRIFHLPLSILDPGLQGKGEILFSVFTPGRAWCRVLSTEYWTYSER